MRQDNRKEIGQIGEEIAVTFLVEKGWDILHRNWATRLGELDIIAKDLAVIVFVEVRTTTGKQFGLGFESIDVRKQQKVRRLAVQYIQQYGLEKAPIRCDVLSVLLHKNLILNHVTHFEGAF